MPPTTWTIARIRELVDRKFKNCACLFQANVGLAVRQRKNDVVGIAATGSGKTLSFWIPLLMALDDGEDKCMLVVTPLNLLGKQNIDLLAKAGISGVAVDRSNATRKTFDDIEAGKHQVIVMNPEILMQEGGHCDRLWKQKSFTSRLLYVVFDEAHCIQEWSSFREQYKHVGALRHLLPDIIPFYIASATMPDPLLADISEMVQLRKDRTELIIRSNDRPDIALCVRKMAHTSNSFKDLEFLIPDGFAEGDTPPPKFLVFCSSIKETEAACRYLRSRLPEHLRLSKIKYFHVSMTSQYRVDEYEALKNGDTFGMCVTDAFGMGLDLTGIQVVVQWKAPTSMNTLWQRFGRAARGLDEFAFAILIVEKQYFDDELEKRAQAKEKKKNRPKRKRKKTQKTADVPQKCLQVAGDDRTGLTSATSAGPSSSAASAGPSTAAARHADEEQGSDVGSDVEMVVDEELGQEPAAAAGSSTMARAESSPSIDVEERRTTYNRRAETSPIAVKVAAKVEHTPHIAVLDLINADIRKLGCRRVPITLVYSNDKRVWDHMQCDLSSPSGCQRCAPKAALVCCDLCHPLAFEALVITGTKPMKGTRKSNIKAYDNGQRERDLRNLLLRWRDEEMKKRFKPAALKNHGGSLVLPLATLQRVVDCAHAGKLLTPEDYKREVPSTKDWVERYAVHVLAIVHEVYPVPPGPADLAGTEHVEAVRGAGDGEAQAIDEDLQARKRKAPTCSRCKQPGHNSRNKNCPALITPSTSAGPVAAVAAVTTSAMHLESPSSFVHHPLSHGGATASSSSRSFTPMQQL